MATAKQTELMNDMLEILDTEFDYGTIGKKKFFTSQEACKLIGLNHAEFWTIMDEGQCTVKQYNQLTSIAGRKPKKERHHISFMQAVEWIKQYAS
jgi:hypothetical protein